MTDHRGFEPSPSAFPRLLNILLPKGGYVVALWEAYVDESGDENSDAVFVLGGYLLRSEEALFLEEKWQKAVRKARVPYFHMVDCAHGSGEYKLVSKEKRIKLASRCIELIRNYVEIGMCFVMNPPKWGLGSGREEIDNVYGHASTMLLSYFADYIRKVDDDPKLSIVFESGHSTQHLARRAIENNMVLSKLFPNGRAPSVTFAAKTEACLLQSADLFAWQAAKYIKDIVNNNGRKPRADFLALMRASHEFYYYYTFDDGINILRDISPTGPNQDMAAYLRALFGKRNDSDAVLKAFHAKHSITRPNTEKLIIDFLSRSWVDEPTFQTGTS
jgi:hypothetical protein